MATIDTADYLTLTEAQAIRDALENPHFISGFRKIFAFDQKWHQETMEQAALADVVNTNRVVQAAARVRAAKEWLHTIKTRMETLTARHG